MPWTDPYDVVLEDTLAVNVNPDDPNQIDNNNYKAGRSRVGLGTAARPDGHVASRPRRRPLGGGPRSPSPGRSRTRAPASAARRLGRRRLADRRPGRRARYLRNSLRLGTVTHDGGARRPGRLHRHARRSTPVAVGPRAVHRRQDGREARAVARSRRGEQQRRRRLASSPRCRPTWWSRASRSCRRTARAR